MATTLTLCMLFTLFASTGCEKRVDSANVDVVNRQQVAAQKRVKTVESVDEGLTMKEVEAVLGTPTEEKKGKVTVPVQKEFVLTTWIYRQDGKEVELSFIDGKLQGKVPQFGEALEPHAPLRMEHGKQTTPKAP
jgi:hypothetical protein